MNGEPYYFTLGVPDVDLARNFYAELFGWELVDNGHIANLALSGGIAPAEFGLGPTVYLRCDDVDEGVARVRALGGTATDPVESFSGVHVACVDDQGTAFHMGWTRDELEADQQSGLDELPAPRSVLGYLTIGVPDVDRAAAFYHELFGWEAQPKAPSSVAGASYRHVTSTKLPLGFGDHDLEQRLHLYFTVEDASKAAAEVERLGGAVEGLSTSDSGVSSNCHDDQGMPFSIWEPATGC